MRRLMPLLLLACCSEPDARLTDGFGRAVTGDDVLAYALGARFELYASVDGAIESSPADIFAIDAESDDLFVVVAANEGDATLTYRTEDDELQVDARVLRATGLSMPEALVIPGGLARLVIEASNGGTTLAVRGQTMVSDEIARAETPELGADEVWVQMPPDLDAVTVDVGLDSGDGVDSFPVTLTTIGAGAVADLTLETDVHGITQARLWTVDGEEILGGFFVWTLDDEDVSTDGVPGDRVQRVPGPQARDLCVRAHGQSACIRTSANGYRAI